MDINKMIEGLVESCTSNDEAIVEMKKENAGFKKKIKQLEKIKETLSDIYDA